VLCVQNDPVVTAELFFQYMTKLITAYPDVNKLRDTIQFDADSETFSAMARAYGNSPLFARSIVT